MEYKEWEEATGQFRWLWAVMHGNWGGLGYLDIRVRKASDIHPVSYIGQRLIETDTEVWLAFGSPQAIGQKPRVFHVEILPLIPDKTLGEMIRRGPNPGLGLLYITTKQIETGSPQGISPDYFYRQKNLTVYKPSVWKRSFVDLYL